MTDTAAPFDDVTLFGGRGFAFREVRALIRGMLGSATMGVAAVATVGASAATVAVAGVWMVGVALSGNPHLQARAPAGPARLALADPLALPQSSFEAKWALASLAVTTARRPVRRAANRQVARADSTILSPHPLSQLHAKHKFHVEHEVQVEVKHEAAAVPALPQVAKLTPPARPVPVERHAARPAPRPAVVATVHVPLPRARPVHPEIAVAPTTKPAHQVAAVTTPAVQERTAPHETKKTVKKAPVLPGPDSRTALYDIAGHTVYLPDGTQLEAHSGLGYRRDDPRFIKVKNLGPTPPNVYDLTLRERLFHGVRAVRMIPVTGSKMFGRDGMLAHSYMLGASGQSNGCVSFRDYDKFLHAFLGGKVDRLVVVRNLDEAPARLASLTRARHSGGYRYAANEINPLSW